MQHIVLAANHTQVFVCQVEIEFLPVFRYSEVLLCIFVFHFPCQEIECTPLQQTIHHWRIYDGIAPSDVFVQHLKLADALHHVFTLSWHNFKA